MKSHTRITLIILFLFLIACKGNIKKTKTTYEQKKSEKINLEKLIESKGEIAKQKGKTFYNEIIDLKKNDNFTFMNYISKIPKATLPITSDDYKFFLTEKKFDINGHFKYEINKNSIKNYPIFFVSDFGFDSIKKANISEIGLLNESLSEYSIKKMKESHDNFFYYVIPVFYFPIDDIYVVGYVLSLDRDSSIDFFPSITIQVYNKKGESLDSKWDYICMLYAYATPYNNYYSYKSSSISKDYIVTEKRKNNNPDIPNRTVKWKITKKGLELIK